MRLHQVGLEQWQQISCRFAAIASQLGTKRANLCRQAFICRFGFRQHRQVDGERGAACSIPVLRPQDDGAVAQHGPGDFVAGLQTEPLADVPGHGDLALARDCGWLRHVKSFFTISDIVNQGVAIVN